MTELAVYPREAVARALDDPSLLEALRHAFRTASEGRVSSPPRAVALVPERQGYLGAMPVFLPTAGVLGAKLVSVMPGNAALALPTHHAVFVAFDPDDGRPRALLDAEIITERRTAAASALSTELLARPDAAVLAIFGTGVQARAHARALARVRRFVEVRVWGRRVEAAQRLAEELERDPALEGATVRAVPAREEAIAGADVACFATHADSPLLPASAIPEGCHVLSVGVNPSGAEVEPALTRRARVFVELRAAAFASPPSGAPDLRAAVAHGWLREDEAAELGELLLGTRRGREDPNEVTYYRSVGVAFEDAAAVALVLARGTPAGTVPL